MLYSVFFDLEKKKEERSKEERKKDNNRLDVIKATLIMKCTAFLSLMIIFGSLIAG